MSKRLWRIETRATVRRIYLVKAENERDAEAASVNAEPEHEEKENEETLTIGPA